MIPRQLKATILIWTILLAGCGQRSEKIYNCQGDQNSYRTNFDSSVFKFEDFSIILRKKLSLLALAQGETLYEITGSVSPKMEAITQKYQIFAEDKKSDTAFNFDLISKKFTYSKPNNYGYHNYLEGRCSMVEI